VCGVDLDRADQPPDAGAGEGCIGGDSDGRAGAVEVRTSIPSGNGILDFVFGRGVWAKDFCRIACR